MSRIRTLTTTLLCTFCFFTFLILPTFVEAQNQVATASTTVPLNQDGTIVAGNGFVPCSGAGCDSCHVLIVINTLIKWLIGLSFLFFAALAFAAGFKMVMAGGNSGALQDAKSSFTNAFIGLFIILAAWLMVDTLMRGILKGGTGDVNGYGPWSEIECGGQVVPGIVAGFIPGDPSPDLAPAAAGAFSYQLYVRNTADNCKQGISNSFPDEAACQTSLTGQTSGKEFYLVAVCTGIPVPPQDISWIGLPTCGATPSPTADGQFSYQSGIAAQAVDASAPLTAMLTCMAGIVPGAVGQISSISDSRITPGSRTFAQCRLGGCAHAVNSYHYGNTGRCGDRSYAVDFGDEQNVSVLCAAANSCGAVKGCSVHNGNHVHLELPVTCN